MISFLKRFLEPALYNKKEFLKSIFCWFVISFINVYSIFLISDIVNIIINEDLEWAKSIIIIFVSLNIFSFIFQFATQNWRWINLDNEIVKFLDKKYFKKLNVLDNTIIETFGTWRLISIISEARWKWSEFLSEWLRVWTSFIVTLISLFILLLQFWNNIYFWIVLLLLVITFLFVLNRAKASMPYRKWIVNEKIVYKRQEVKMIMNKFEILQNNKIDNEIAILNKERDLVSDYIRKTWTKSIMVLYMIPNFIIFITYFIFLLIFIYTKTSFSFMFAFFMILTYFKAILWDLVLYFTKYTKDSAQIYKLWDLFDNTPEIANLNEWKKFKYKSWDFKVKNLYFSYWNNNVFSNFSVEIEWEKVTALVWESGWWKTTLMKLLAWFIKANSWEIIVDWQNLNNIKLISYYKEIWYLTQEPSVFDWTIIENLLYWTKEEVSEKRLKEVIKLAKCDFIFEFEKWLDTEIGERWIRLSWWQKQRIAIAKMFIKDPKIIFLDEPTSALDSFSEKLIQESFSNLFEWRTVVIIAHRLQTVKNADKIYVIEKWKIIESWTHKSLIKKWDYYKMMLDLQSGF